MFNKQNLHTHTTYVDGKDIPEELVIEAIARNFGSIGFSEHMYCKYSPLTSRFTADKMEGYKNEITALKQKYAHQIDIFLGVEDEFYSEEPLDGFDYVIGSIHYLQSGGKFVGFDSGLEATLNCINTYFDGNSFAFSKEYFETVARLPQKTDYDILGHFDIITKNNEKGHFLDTASKEYINLGLEAISALKGKIPLFEVNTGAIARGYTTAPYPQMEFLKEFYSQGFGVVITTDCHNKDFLDCFYKQAEELVSAVGFKTKWVFTSEGFKEVAL